MKKRAVAILMSLTLAIGNMISMPVYAAQESTEESTEEITVEEEASLSASSSDRSSGSSFNWRNYFEETLVPQYGYADMEPKDLIWESYHYVPKDFSWEDSKGIVGADIVDLTDDGKKDLVLYRTDYMSGNSGEYYGLSASLYTEDNGTVTSMGELWITGFGNTMGDGISGFGYDHFRVGIVEVDGKPCIWTEGIVNSYRANRTGFCINVDGWDGSKFRLLKRIGKTDGGSSDQAYSLQTFNANGGSSKEVFWSDGQFWHYHQNDSSVTGGPGNQCSSAGEAVVEIYKRLGLPDPENSVYEQSYWDCGLGSQIFPTYWSTDTMKASVEFGTEGDRGDTLQFKIANHTKLEDISIEYTLKDGILSITKWGEDVPAFTKPEDAPWHDDRGSIKQVIIEGDDNAVVRIDDYAFTDCPSLRSVCLEKSVPEIGGHAFSGDVVTIYQKRELNGGEYPSSLASLDGVTGWIVWGFESDEHLLLTGRNKMEDLTADTINYLPWGRGGEYKILEVTVSGDITRVGDYAFGSLTNLTLANIGKSIREVGSHIMPEPQESEQDEDKMARKNIRFKGNAPGFWEDAFAGADIIAYVPPFDDTWNSGNMLDYGGSVAWGAIDWDYEDSEYEYDTNRENYVNGKKLIISGNGRIPDYRGQFELPWSINDQVITEVTVENGVTEIGSNAFLYLDRISVIHIPGSVVRVGPDAFKTHAKGAEGNYQGGPRIVFGGNAPQDFASTAFGSDCVYKSNDNDQPLDMAFPIDIYYPAESEGWDELMQRSWPNSYLAWIEGEPKDVIKRPEVWGFDGSIDVKTKTSDFGKASEGYYLSLEDRNTLFKNLRYTEKKAIQMSDKDIMRYNLDGNTIDGKFEVSGGSCRGFAITEGLLYGNIISPDFITKPLGSFEKNSPSNKTESFINFYHLQQYLPKVEQYQSEWCRKPQEQQLVELEQMVRNAQERNQMVDISFQIEYESVDDKGKKSIHQLGHSIMGYAIEEGVFHVNANSREYTFDHRILTYDAHDYKNSHATVRGDQSGINYHTHAFYYSTAEKMDTCGMWLIPYTYMRYPCSTTNGMHYNDTTDNARLMSVGTGENYLNAIDYETGECNFREGLSFKMISTKEQNFSVVLRDGTRYEIRDGSMDNADDGTVVVGSVAGDIPSDSLSVVFGKDIEECTVETDSGGSFDFYSSGDGILTSAYIDRQGEIQFSHDGGIQVDSGTRGETWIEVTKDDINNSSGDPILPEHTVRLAMDDASTVTETVSENGLVVQSDQTDNVSIAAENLDTDEMKEIQCPIDNNSIEIGRSEDGEFLIRKDTDGDGDHETNVDYANSGQISAKGDISETLYWELDSDGLLCVLGEGSIPGYYSEVSREEDNQGVDEAPWYEYRDSIVMLFVGDGVNEIGHHAFAQYENLEYIVLPDSLSSIGEGAFQNCYALDEIQWGTGLRKIDRFAFNHCDSLKEIVVPDGVEYIGDYALAWSDGVESIVLPDSVKEAGTNVFAESPLLKNVKLGRGLTSIPGGAFYNCPSLESITIPEGVKSIGGCAFEDCPGLKKIVLPKSLEAVDESAFANCKNLASVVFNGTKAQWKQVYFGGGNYYIKRLKIKCSDGYLKLVSALQITLPKTAYPYTGKAITPAVTLKSGSITLKNGTHYTVKYTNNTKVGTATITITGKGAYWGTVKKTFKIYPKGTSIVSLTPGSKQFTVKWNKQATQTTGYQIQCCTDKSFKSNVKMVTVNGTAYTSRKVTVSKAKTTYYVRMRTFKKNASGAMYYSGWSAVKSVKTK